MRRQTLRCRLTRTRGRGALTLEVVVGPIPSHLGVVLVMHT